MIEFGSTLRQAREAKGLSIAKIAEKTHMMSSIVEDLENERFGKIVAPIYGRGFVKLYCNAVGLDPKPMVEEFMAIYTGRREPIIKERPVIAPAQVADAPAQVADAPEQVMPAPEPIAPAPEPIVAAPAPIAPAPAPVAAAPEPVAPAPKAAEESPFSYQDDFFEAPKTLPRPTFHTSETLEPKEKLPNRPSRFAPYAAPLKNGFDAFPEIAPVVLRWTMLTVIAGLFVWGIVAGIGALYRATAKTPTEVVADHQPTPDIFEEPASADAPSGEIAQPAQRTPITVPPLYID